MVSHSNGTISNARQFIYSPFLIVATQLSFRLHIWVVSSRQEYQSQPDCLDSTLISPRLSMERVHYRTVCLKRNMHQNPSPITCTEAGSDRLNPPQQSVICLLKTFGEGFSHINCQAVFQGPYIFKDLFSPLLNIENSASLSSLWHINIQEACHVLLNLLFLGTKQTQFLQIFHVCALYLLSLRHQA